MNRLKSKIRILDFEMALSSHRNDWTPMIGERSQLVCVRKERPSSHLLLIWDQLSRIHRSMRFSTFNHLTVAAAINQESLSERVLPNGHVRKSREITMACRMVGREVDLTAT